MKLTGKIFSGGTSGADKITWTQEEVESGDLFKIESTASSGYTDITSIEKWSTLGSYVGLDYQDTQKAVRLAMYDKRWSACTTEERNMAIDFYANPQINPTGSTQNTEVVTHLMTTKGFSLQQSTDYMVDKWWDHWSKFLENCPERWKRAVKVAVQYLSFVDASDLFDEIETLVGYYLNSGRLGLEYGDNRDGIMDYIMSINAYDGNGLEDNDYTLKKGTWEEFKSEIEKCLVSDHFWTDLQVHIDNLM